MSITRKRLNPEESRSAALEAARRLLIERGPQAVALVVDNSFATGWRDGDETLFTRARARAQQILEGVGHEGIAALSDVVFEHFPGHSFRRTSAVDAHHGVARYGWELVAPDGTVAVGGIDVAELDDDGRLVRVTGFFGDLPPLEA